ncbi:hypothetical protein GCM10009678_77240 [Actinomadura kijaniata]|uniref:Peptidyl-prolyl cis-trans isomerase n=1 Tax=Actinomadura namibiensis TaxID=182080 RepID=A0A7W3LXR7_ACTNM|nr:peptidylprolyl isomerase [Actinomadura namibiensis]MBA8956284.1 peptidyl-prolyl cis-trans isomerase B (cyclophilin B) [Actinomadura namibiensis]
MAAKDRKKELARQRYERQQARRQAEAARARRVKIVGAGVAVAVIAVGGGVAYAMTRSDDKKDKKDTTAAAGACTYTRAEEKGAPKNLGTPPAKPVHTGPVQATIKTAQGDVGLELDGAKAPCATNSFAFLAEKGFWKNTFCHRLSTGEGLKMLQCGDPTGTGQGGPGYQFGNENTEGATYKKGTLAMANAGPGTNGSQFFLVYGDSQLSPDYTVFGKITKGMDVLEKVAAGGIDKPGPDGTGAPKKKVTIQDVSIVGK